MEKILKIGESVIRCYNYDAFPLMILEGNNCDYKQWLLSNYIQINCNNDILSLPDLFIMFHGPTEYECPYIKTQRIYRDTLIDLNVPISEFLVKMIKQDYYVYLQVDVFFIPQRFNIKDYHYIHDIMIHGFNDSEKKFKCVCVDYKGEYTSQDISYEMLEKAFYTEELDWNDYICADRISMYKYEPDKVYKFNLNLVILQLEDYLKSQNTFEIYHRFKTANPKRDDGIGVLNRISQYLQMIIESKINPEEYDMEKVDIRLFRLLYDHKILMMLRLEYINVNIYDISDIVDRYKECVERSKILHKLSFKFRLKRDNAIIVRMLKLMEELRDLEYILITELVQAMKMNKVGELNE